MRERDQSDEQHHQPPAEHPGTVVESIHFHVPCQCGTGARDPKIKSCWRECVRANPRLPNRPGHRAGLAPAHRIRPAQHLAFHALDHDPHTTSIGTLNKSNPNSPFCSSSTGSPGALTMRLTRIPGKSWQGCRNRSTPAMRRPVHRNQQPGFDLERMFALPSPNDSTKVILNSRVACSNGMIPEAKSIGRSPPVLQDSPLQSRPRQEEHCLAAVRRSRGHGPTEDQPPPRSPQAGVAMSE